MSSSLSVALEALVVSGAALGLVWYLRSRQQHAARWNSPEESMPEKGSGAVQTLTGGLPDPDPLHEFNLASKLFEVFVRA